MTDISDQVEQLKRAVAVPGKFEIYYPETTDDDLTGALEDAFAQCQLDGFFPTYQLDLNTGLVTPDLLLSEIRMIVLYSSIRIIQTQLMNTKNQTRYEAGGAVYDVQTSSNVLTAILNELVTEKKDIITRLQQVSTAAAYATVDAYFTRAVTRGPYWGYPEYIGDNYGGF